MIKQETVTAYSSGITPVSIISVLLITDFRTSLMYHKWHRCVTFAAISSSVDDHVITSEQLPFVCQTIEVTTESEEQTVSSSHVYPLQISPVSSCYGEIHTHKHTELYLKPFFMFISVSIPSEKSGVWTKGFSPCSYCVLLVGIKVWIFKNIWQWVFYVTVTSTWMSGS